jgi:uncharacterized membrane protein HdeD (DUF308 family)
MALRGIVAIIFGVIALRYPGAAASAFVIVFAVFAFADAILDFVVAGTFGRMGMRWGWYVFAALVSIAAGVLALAYPSATFLVLVLLVGARAFAMGIVEIGAAFSWKDIGSRWLVALTGLLSIVFAVLLFVSPAEGGLALLWVIGIYAVVLGVMMIGLGMWTGTRRQSLSSTLPSPA